jgi:2-hydroxychromene-2-carboxylate isomerase
VFDALWTTGADPTAPDTWQGITRALGVANADLRTEAPEVKQRLRDNTETAIAAGVFGVPTLLVGDRLFWGEDSLPMLAAYLAEDPIFHSPPMLAARKVRFGAHRRQQ